MFQETQPGLPSGGYDGSGSVNPVSKEVVEAQKNRIVQMLLQGKTYGLPGSDGKMWSNFREWAKNQHPVLSMCFAHELHPFSRTERLSVLLCYLCWAFLITCVFEQMNHDNQEICDGGCETTNTHHSTLEEMCGSGSSDNSQKVSVEDYSNACDDIMPWYVLSFTIAACTVPYSTILKVLATCGCVQKLPHFIKRCFEFIGTIMLSVFGCLSLVWLGVGISISLTLDGGMFLVTYLTGVVKSWFYWPMIAGVVFLWKYKRAKRRFEEEHPGQVAMAWPIDQQDIVKMDDDGKPAAYQSPPGSPRSGDGEKYRKAGAHDGYRGTGTPEPTPSPRPVTFNGGYARPPRYEPEDGLYMSPPSPSDGYPTAPPCPPAVNPYCNQQDACTGSPHHGQQQTGTFQGYIGMAQGLPTPPPGSPVGLHGSPEHGIAGEIGVALVLPPGWKTKVLPEGRIMYIDHNTQVGAGMGPECGGYAPTACHRSPSIACTGVGKKQCTASSFFAIQWVSRLFSHMYFALCEVKEQESVVIRSVQSQPHGTNVSGESPTFCDETLLPEYQVKRGKVVEQQEMGLEKLHVPAFKLNPTEWHALTVGTPPK